MGKSYNYDGIISSTFSGLVDELNKRNIPKENIVSIFTNAFEQYLALYCNIYDTKH